LHKGHSQYHPMPFGSLALRLLYQF